MTALITGTAECIEVRRVGALYYSSGTNASIYLGSQRLFRSGFTCSGYDRADDPTNLRSIVTVSPLYGEIVEIEGQNESLAA